MNQSVNLFAALHTFIQCLQSTCSYQGSCRMPQGISLLCDILAGSEISNWYHLRNYYLVIYNTVVTNKSTVHKNRLNAVILQKPLSHAGIIVYSISGRLDDKKSIFSHLSHVTLVLFVPAAAAGLMSSLKHPKTCRLSRTVTRWLTAPIRS